MLVPFKFIVWLVFLGGGILLALRIVFKLIGADPGTLFVQWVYSFTSLWLVPFVGMLPSFTTGKSTLEYSAIVALLVTALLGLLLLSLVSYLERRTWR